MPSFEEALTVVDFVDGVPVPGEIAPEQPLEALVYKALCLGVKDYVGKNGFPGVLLGLSGGIDSALVVCVAADALGADKVRAVMMPSQYTAGMSLEDAEALAANLGVRYTVMPIKPVFDKFLDTLAGEFKDLPYDTTEENLQSRIRGTLLMALSNKFGSIVLTTGNKSEMGTGYATLYGDMAGGFAVLKDISKTLVYRLCNWRNGIGPVIPAAHHHAPAVGRTEAQPGGPGQPAALRGAGRDHGALRRARPRARWKSCGSASPGPTWSGWCAC